MHEKVQEGTSGSHRPSQVDGWNTAACAAPRSGLPPRTNRFHSGARPFAIASRSAALHGRFAKARSDRIAFLAGENAAASGRFLQGTSP